MLSPAELRLIQDARNNLKTDRRNTRRRDRYRETHPRYCGCGREITGTNLRRCTRCVWHAAERTCRGWEDHPCSMVMESRRLRCPACRELHRDWLRDRRNARRRNAYASKR